MDCKVFNNRLSFTAGISPEISREFRVINPAEVTEYLQKNYSTVCDFEDNKVIAGGVLRALNILKETAERFRLPFLTTTPPKLKVFKPNELVKFDDVNFGFCIGEKEKIIRKHPEYEPYSVFIKNTKDNLNEFNSMVEKWYNKRILSSDHFLAPFFHELFHTIHLNLISSKNTKYGIQEIISLQNKGFDFQDSYVIKDKIGTYASKSRLELFSEVWSKIITNSLNDNITRVVSNPLDNLKDFPKFIKEFVETEISR